MVDKRNIIWEMHRFMLPEVPEAVQEQEEKNKLVEKPLLAEDKFQELELSLREAIELARPARFTYYCGGIIKSVIGLPLRVKGTYLFLLHGLGELRIPLKDLLDIQP